MRVANVAGVRNSAAKAIFGALLATIFTAGCAFFTYYTARLAYVNLTVPDISAHRQSGMYIGAVAFPLAALIFGYLGFRCGRASLRAMRTGRGSIET